MSSLLIPTVADDLLDFVYDALDCSPNGRPCHKILSLCEPMNPCSDYLAVYVNELPGSEGIEGCDALDPCEGYIVFNIKLSRGWNPNVSCDPTVVDKAIVKGLIVDAVVLRSAIIKFAQQMDVPLCGVDYQIIPFVANCVDNEQTSGWIGAIAIRLPITDDGPCPTPLTPFPAECGALPSDIVDNTSSNLEVELGQI